MSTVFTCSLDDGNPLDMKAAEILKKNEINATFFVPVKNSEGPPTLSASQIRLLSNGYEIGSHTFNHRYLNGLPFSDAEEEVKSGKVELENILGRQVSGFCYPGGKYRHQHIEIVRSLRFRYARTTKNLCFGPGKYVFEMPTTVQFYPHTRDVYIRNFIKGKNWLNKLKGLQLALEHEKWIDRLYALFDYCMENGGLFHLWAHSEDIEKLNAWREFDNFLRYVQSRVAPEDRLTNEQVVDRYLLMVPTKSHRYEDSYRT